MGRRYATPYNSHSLPMCSAFFKNPQSYRLSNSIATIMYTEFAVDVVGVPFNGYGRDKEAFADLFVFQPLSEQGQDLVFSVG